MTVCAHEREEDFDYRVIDAAAIPDTFSSGTLMIEPVGPNLSRLIWYVLKKSHSGPVQIPVASLLLPSTSLMMVAGQLATAHALAISDFVGQPVGMA